jgi:iron complex outermembrane receptor protein
VRYGGKAGADGTFRAYAKGYEIQNTKRANDSSVADGWERGQAGFRADWGAAGSGLTLQGDIYKGRTEDRPRGNALEVAGMNLLGRWSYRFDSGSEFRLQAYYDRTEREDLVNFQGDADVFDVEFQHAVPLGGHRLLWGAGYRRSRDDIPSTLPPLVIAFVPPARTLDWANVFVQDEIRLSPEVELSIGVKLERNDYTGWEYLPSARLAWKPADRSLVWTAFSRAVRAPARLDRDFTLSVVAPPIEVPVIRGGPTFESEIASVVELGYRAQPADRLSYSVTAFFHDYDRLRSGQPAPAFIQNMIEGPIAGVEAWGSFTPVPWWRLSGGFTTLHKHLGLKPGSTDPVGPSALGNDPEYQWQLRSAFNPAPRHELDVALRRVGALPQPAVPAYVALDARWGWKVTRDVEASLTLENVLDRAHPEFGALPGRSEYGRAAFLKLLLRL